jgi:hypothetical protein
MQWICVWVQCGSLSYRGKRKRLQICKIKDSRIYEYYQVRFCGNFVCSWFLFEYTCFLIQREPDKLTYWSVPYCVVSFRYCRHKRYAAQLLESWTNYYMRQTVCTILVSVMPDAYGPLRRHIGMAITKNVRSKKAPPASCSYNRSIHIPSKVPRERHFVMKATSSEQN